MSVTAGRCTVVVDMGKCSGLGLCEAVAPEVFEIGDDGALLVHHNSFDLADRALLEEAAASCPTQAIEIRVEDS
ncbi:ferredoxin [Nocardia shimofusensis]|uniref:ferredoxin n=1 Tax=Nocardia shimofusensis TaxID=228596 RepID=UPI00082C8F2B|nr:ferredoxin [Nocardia shimofusensis]